MNVDAWSPSTLSVVEGCMGSTPVHFAWSRDLYQSAAVTFTVNEAKQLSLPSLPKERKRKERERGEREKRAKDNCWRRRQAQDDRQGVGTTLIKPLCTGHRPYHGTIKPSARRHPTNSPHGLPDHNPSLSRRRSARSGVATGTALAVRRKLAVHLITIELHTLFGCNGQSCWTLE